MEDGKVFPHLSEKPFRTFIKILSHFVGGALATTVGFKAVNLLISLPKFRDSSRKEMGWH